MRKPLIIAGIILIIILFTLVACESTPIQTPTLAPTPEQTPKPELKPKIVTFPFSWEEDERGYLTEISGNPGIIKVTVNNVKPLGTATLAEIGLGGIEAEKGYQFYGVNMTFKSLMNKAWSSPYGVYVGALLELETDRGNSYKSGGIPRVIDLKPEQEKDDWDYFEIRVDEKPIELRHYDIINPDAPSSQQKLNVAYVWEIK